MPSGFICGDHDPVRQMDRRRHRADAGHLPDFRGGTLLDGAGHWTQQEAPAAFNAALLAFLADVS